MSRHLPILAEPITDDLRFRIADAIMRDDQAEFLDYDPECDRCSASRRPKACAPPRGHPGGVLLLGEAPTLKGGPWGSQVEVQILSEVTRIYAGPVAVDYAARCACMSSNTTAFDACTPYARRADLDLHPKRILAFGAMAWRRACLGEAPLVQQVTARGDAMRQTIRRAWKRREDGVVVYFLPDLAATARNRIARREMIQDARWAARHEAPPDVVPDVREVSDEATAERVVNEMIGRPVVFDCETFGRVHSSEFKIAVLATAAEDRDAPVWTWPEESMLPGDPRRPHLQRLLRAGQLVGHGVKFDLTAARTYLDADPGRRGLAADTMMLAKLRRTNFKGGLDQMGYLVGAGGHKAPMEQEKERVKRLLSKLRSDAKKYVVVAYRTEQRVDKRGRVSQRQVPSQARPPSDQEQEAQVRDGWARERMINKRKSTVCREVGYPDGAPIPDDWMRAALSNLEPDTYAYGLADRELCTRYCAMDVAVTRALYLLLRDMPGSAAAVWRSHVSALPWAAGWIEQWGMLVNEQRRAELEVELDGRIARLDAQLKDAAGDPEFNPGSDQQVAKLLYETLGLPPGRVTDKGKLSVDVKERERLAGRHPAIELLDEYEKVTKMQGTFVRGLKEHVGADGRVHPNYNIAVNSSRWSCSSPNLQQIPSRDPEMSKAVKGLYEATTGYKLAFFDYATLELRIAAMLSNDRVMIEAFDRGEDLHKRTAQIISSHVWGEPFEAGDEEAQKFRRGVGKTLNFALIFGQSTMTMAENLGIPVETAERSQKAMFGGYRQLGAWMRRTARDGERDGGVWLWWNGERSRFRPVLDLASQDDRAKGHGRRVSRNTPIQGTAAEYCSASAVELVRRIHDDCLDAKLIVQIHDALGFEVADADVDELCRTVKGVMEGWPPANGVAVPLAVDATVGQNWAEMEKWVDPACVSGETAQEGA